MTVVDGVPAWFAWAQAQVNRACATLAGVALFLMMLAGAADVITTNFDLMGIPAQPIPSTAEFMATMLVLAVFLSVPFAQAQRAHIRITLSRVKSPRLDSALALVRHGLHGLFYGLIAWYAWPVAVHAAVTNEFAPGLVNFPVWPARFLLALGASVMTAQCTLDVLGIVDPRCRVATGGSAATGS